MHKLIRRTTARTAAEKGKEPAADNGAGARLRFSSSQARQSVGDRSRMVDLLNLIAEQDDAIEKAVACHADAMKELEDLMRKHRLTVVPAARRVAQFVEEFGRQSTSIDPKRFKAAVSNEVFWKCISVQVTKAKEHMALKEFAAVADVTPPTSKGHRLKVVDRVEYEESVRKGK